MPEDTPAPRRTDGGRGRAPSYERRSNSATKVSSASYTKTTGPVGGRLRPTTIPKTTPAPRRTDGGRGRAPSYKQRSTSATKVSSASYTKTTGPVGGRSRPTAIPKITPAPRRTDGGRSRAPSYEQRSNSATKVSSASYTKATGPVGGRLRPTALPKTTPTPRRADDGRGQAPSYSDSSPITRSSPCCQSGSTRPKSRCRLTVSRQE